jgi:hypothetical protein
VQTGPTSPVNAVSAFRAGKRITVMRLLLEPGADPSINTNDGATPLMAAAGVNWVIGQTFSHSDAGSGSGEALHRKR